MYIYGKVIADMIEKEKQGKSYRYNKHDRIILEAMISEINQKLGTNLEYLCQIDFYSLKNCSDIILKYIHRFESEGVKGYLIPNLVVDKTENIEEVILKLYFQFKNSEFYISPANAPSSAHIYVRYDNAFRSLKPKKLKKELFDLVSNPRDAAYLPLTVKMLSSWKIPEIKNLLLLYLDGSMITNDSIGIYTDGNYYPSLENIKRQLKFTAIGGLKYYPTDEIIDIINGYTNNEDKDIAKAAKKSLEYIEKKKTERAK